MKEKRDNMKTGVMIFLLCSMIIIISVSFIGCELNELTFGENTEENDSKTTTASNALHTASTTVPPVTTVPITEPPKPPEFLNPLTGLEATKEEAEKRPVSICIGNTASSLPQLGLGCADILVEAPVEGGITRLMMITCNYPKNQVFGSVRATRSYLADIANQFDAVQAYAGTTDLGKSTSFKEYDTLDYIVQNMTSVYYIDSSRNSPHHIMTDGDKLFKGLVSLGLRSVSSNKALPFEFAEYFSRVTLSKNDSFYIRIPFSSAQTAEFRYNTKTETYDRYQFGSIHSDTESAKPLSFKNIILLFCDTTTFDKSTGTEISIDVDSGGTGYYISEGKYMEIIWYKDESSNLKFADKNGSTLTVNRGKSYIALIRVSAKNSVVLNAK